MLKLNHVERLEIEEEIGRMYAACLELSDSNHIPITIKLCFPCHHKNKARYVLTINDIEYPEYNSPQSIVTKLQHHIYNPHVPILKPEFTRGELIAVEPDILKATFVRNIIMRNNKITYITDTGDFPQDVCKHCTLNEEVVNLESASTSMKR